MTNLATRWTAFDATCGHFALWQRFRNSNAKPAERAVHEWENEGGNVAAARDPQREQDDRKPKR